MRRLRIISIILLAAFLCGVEPLCAQRRKVQNKPYIDNRRFHYGFLCAVHSQGIDFENNGHVSTENGQQWYSVNDRQDIGFSVGVLGEWRLDKYFALRTTPTIHFGQKHLTFHEQGTGRETTESQRSTLIAVPVSLIGTFFFLKIIGFSINLLTLSALLLAIAIVVDDAIVVVEAVHAKLDQGYKSALTASIDAMNEISGAIISITLVMASVFIPVSFIGGTSGTFYREFGVTMAVSIFISALNALTLSPALCAIFLKPHDANGKERKMSMIDRFHTSFNTAFDKTLDKYKNWVTKFVRKPLMAGLAVVVGIVVLVWSMISVGSSPVISRNSSSVGRLPEWYFRISSPSLNHVPPPLDLFIASKVFLSVK